jgi:hypothetical protein
MANGNHNIETPHLSYVRPDTDDRVDLVGLVHYAEPRYYEQVQAIIDDRTAQGAVVHYETVKSVSQSEYDAAPRRVRRNIKRIDAIFRSIASLAEGAGLVGQVDSLVVRDGWELHDVDEVSLSTDLNGLALSGLAMLAKMGSILARIAPAEVKRDVVVQVLSTSEVHTGSLALRTLYDPNIAVLLDDRNGTALTTADRHFASSVGSGLVLPWGAEHLEGLAAGFESRGFTKIAEQTLTAIHA